MNKKEKKELAELRERLENAERKAHAFDDLSDALFNEWRDRIEQMVDEAVDTAADEMQVVR